MNMSFGSQYGPHDGSSAFETAISALTGSGRIVVVSAGNDGGTLNPNYGIHAGVNVTSPSSAVTLSIAGSASNRIAGITGYYEATEAMNVTVSGPPGSSGPVTFGNINAVYPGVALGTARLYIENGAFLSSTGAREVYIEIRGGVSTSINGTWTITFTPTAPAGADNGRVDLWRFFASTGLTANFVTNREDAYLISEPGTATGVITVGSWVTKTGWTNCASLFISYSATNPATFVGGLSPFSSNGPTRDERLKPDIAAPGQGIGSTRSLDINPGTCNTTPAFYSYLPDNMMHVINQGTSMAAPHVTGAVALLLQKFGSLTRTEILTKLAATALSDFNTGGVPNPQWGVGKLRVDVTDPTVTVGYPNGGQTLIVGSAADLQWTAGDPVWSGVASVDLQLSRNNGGSWEDIALGVANTGSYGWTATGPLTAQALLKVRAHDRGGNFAEDVSDAVFRLGIEAQLTCDPDTALCPCDSVTRLVEIHNPAPSSETFHWSITDALGWCAGDTGSVTVAGGSSTTVSWTCAAPCSLLGGGTNTLTAIAVAASDPAGADTCTTEVAVDPAPAANALCPPDTSGVKGSTVQLDFRIENGGGCGLVVYRVTETLGWLGTVMDTVAIGPGDTTLVVRMEAIPETASPGDTNVVSIGAWPLGVPDSADSCSVRVAVTTPVGVPDLPPLPTAYRLLPGAPNPARGRARLAFDVPREGPVSLRIFDAGGRLVRTLAEHRAFPPGRQAVDWDLTDRNGRRVASGVYFYRFTAEGFVETRRLVVAR
jgi:hypothetical protein